MSDSVYLGGLYFLYSFFIYIPQIAGDGGISHVRKQLHVFLHLLVVLAVFFTKLKVDHHHLAVLHHHAVWPAWLSRAGCGGLTVYAMPRAPFVVLSAGGERVKLMTGLAAGEAGRRHE